MNTLKTSDLIEVEVEVEPPPVKPPGVDIFLNPASKVVMVVMLAMMVMVVKVVMVATGDGGDGDGYCDAGDGDGQIPEQLMVLTCSSQDRE